MTKRALLLIGSPKGLEASLSSRYARAIGARLERSGWAVESLHVHRAIEEGDDLVARTAVELVLLVAPLYVDSLPAPVIGAFERMAEGRAGRGETIAPRLAALVHCGFVEPKQNETAIEICRQFAGASGFEWFGALALGGGGIPSRRVTRVLEEAGDALAKGFPIPPETRRRAERPIMPRLFYILGGNLMWRRSAKRSGVSKEDLLAAPYAD